MVLLGVSTSNEECGIALASAEGGGSALLGADAFPGARSCVEELVPRIMGLLESSGLGLRDVDMFAVDVGPGGLTGIKIGLTAVKTLAQVTGRPVAPVSSLHAMCARAADAGLVAPGGFLLPLVNCMKGEFFSALYRSARCDARGAGCGPRGPDCSAQRAECVIKDRLDDAAGLRALLNWISPDAEALVFGNAAAALRAPIEESLGPRVRFAAADFDAPRAETVCRIALSVATVPFHEARPNYLCLTNAERNLGVRA